VSIDSLRHDHLGCYGYARDTSPHIDQLAAEGVRFTNALSPTSWTLPAHMTLLTGLPPERHGVNVDGRRLQKEVLTFAEVLREAGWATAGFVSGPYLHSSYGFAQGFGRYDDATFVSPDVLSHRAVTSPGLVQLVIGWLREWRRAEASAPFFVFLHMWDVHYDFIPPAPFDEMFDPDYEGDVTADLFSRSRDIHPGMERRDLDHVIALYDGEIRYTDFHLGELLDHLAEQGLLDATIVLVTADHGEEFFEHGEKGHGRNLYGETVRVPLVARWPAKISPGGVVDQLVTLEDVPRTLLSLLGIPAAPELARWGRDLSPLLDGPAGSVPRRAAFGDLHGQLAYLRTDSHKFISTLVGQRREELYDLRSDPAERRNLLEARPGLGGEFRAELWSWRGGSAHVDGFAEPAPLPPELELQLRALGYLE
jgi:arylsulfatase